ncbi:hypothetical protein LY76DRAFT_596722 [Colletotrichum caudatum]|nr:hypothetical protein LY76DRAFT_596722 [Colletotrichum caudatum]
MSDTSRSLVEIWTCAPEFTPPDKIRGTSISNQLFVLDGMCNTDYITETFECGLLAMSILWEAEMDVSHILKSWPYASNEANSLGQTLCHLAVGVGNLEEVWSSSSSTPAQTFSTHQTTLVTILSTMLFPETIINTAIKVKILVSATAARSWRLYLIRTVRFIRTLVVTLCAV